MSVDRVCLVPSLSGVGGMVSFQHKLTAGLAARQVKVCHDLDDTPYDAVLVIGGSRQLHKLWRARRRGVPIVQRLDGMNWVHRVQPTGLRHFLRAEYGNRLLTLIRDRLADRVVYQSQFARSWWERVRGAAPVPSTAVYNGVDLQVYTPHGSHDRPQDKYRLLLVEGNLMGGYEWGLENAVHLACEIARDAGGSSGRTGDVEVELMVVGRISAAVKEHWTHASEVPIHWVGVASPEQIPTIDRSAHLLYSADINAACPNSVIEALACGTPVLAFDTGALPELVSDDAGRIVPYGGDPWQLEVPDIPALAGAAAELLTSGEQSRVAARARAEAMFGLDVMVAKYLNVMREL